MNGDGGDQTLEAISKEVIRALIKHKVSGGSILYKVGNKEEANEEDQSA
jgi:hypothetical protein